MDKKWIVSKFGGSSVKDATSMLRCSQIIEENPKRKIIVISATQNTTNQLEKVARAAVSGDKEELAKASAEIIERHSKLAQELFTSPSVMTELQHIFAELIQFTENIQSNGKYSSREMDHLYSFGERISSLLVADLLRLRIPNKEIVFLDARKLIKTNSDFLRAIPLIDVISKEVEKFITKDLSANKIFVTQGFIGEDQEGNTTTLGREGSDYSAALFGEAINAELVEIWTDVPGVASADPRVVPNAKFINELSYDEATALATLGAKVLFPTTLLPAKRNNIPVFVGSSLNPTLGGTMITKNQSSQFSLKAVSQMSDGDDYIISFIGTQLESQKDLESRLIAKLGPSFKISDKSSVSISFKINKSSVISEQLFQTAHEALAQFWS